MNAPVKNWLDPAKEALAVKGLRESLAAVDPDDETLLTDSIEGQTSFFEIVDAILERMLVNEAAVEGIDLVTKSLGARKARYEQRIKSDRALLEQAMTIAELAKIERPTATLSLSARAPSLTITEESDIPATWWKPGNPTLDKKGLADALKARAKALAELPKEGDERAAALAALPPEIPGATLSNGAPSITVRRA